MGLRLAIWIIECSSRNTMYTTISASTAVPETPLTVSKKTTPKYKGRFSIKLDCTRYSRQNKLSSFCGVPKSLGDPPLDRCRSLNAISETTIAIVHRMKITKPQRGKVIFVGWICTIFLSCETAANTLENLPARNLGENCGILVNYCLCSCTYFSNGRISSHQASQPVS